MVIDTSKLIISVLVVVASLAIKLLSYRIIKGVVRKFEFRSSRKTIVVKIINSLLFLITGIVLLGIWEVNPNDLALYFASIFTVIGIAFFAQWSHLSNITAGLIIFFNHPAHVGDSITIIDSDNILRRIRNVKNSGRCEFKFFIALVHERFFNIGSATCLCYNT